MIMGRQVDKLNKFYSRPTQQLQIIKQQQFQFTEEQTN